jgi:hypothetical protein
MYSLNEFFVNMQHRKKFCFEYKNRNNELFFDNSINYIIKQFEDIFFNLFLIKIICKNALIVFFEICLLIIIIIIFHTRYVIDLSRLMRELLYTICMREKSSEK